MSETKETHFTERISSFGFVFIISGLLSFFGFNNYAPYSYYAFNSTSFTQSFWFGDFSWFIPVIIWALLPMVLSIQLYRVRKEMHHPGYNRFSLLYMISSLIQFVVPIVLAIGYILFFYTDFNYDTNPASYFPDVAYIGIFYIAITISIQILQILAWIFIYIISKEKSSKLGKDIKVNFGNAPIILILSNFVSIGALILSIIGTNHVFNLNYIQADYFTMLGTYVSFGWAGLNLLGNLMIGIQILNKPSSQTKKSYVTSKQTKVKKAKQSCPVCRNTIYEGQNTCTNCGYRII